MLVLGVVSGNGRDTSRPYSRPLQGQHAKRCCPPYCKHNLEKRVKFQAAVLFLITILLAGCGEGGIFEDPEAKATRESQGTAYVQTIAVIETQSGTTVALQATAESANLLGTQVAQLSAQNQALQSTLAANQGRATQPIVQSQPIPTTVGVLPGQQSPDAAGGGAQQQDTTIQQTSPTGTTYIDSTTATGVRNSDGCAIDSVAAFDALEDEIYMVTTAVNVQPGMVFNTRWTYGGEVFFESDSWTADKTYDEICIWYYISSPFEEGQYTVELLADGQTAARRTFQVGTGSGGGGETTVEDTTMTEPTPGQ